MTSFKKRLEKEIERRKHVWFPCKDWSYTDPASIAREMKARDERAALKNDDLTKYLAKHSIPVEKIRAEIEKRNKPNCTYFGQSFAYGKRFITKVVLLDGTEITCAIPFTSDGDFCNLGLMHELGGFKVAKWVREIEVQYTWYDYRGFHYTQVDGIPHEETGIVHRRNIA